MAATAIDLSHAASYMKSQLVDSLRKGVINGLHSAALRMVQEIQTRTIPQTVPEPIDRGLYRAGWRVERLDDGAVYFNDIPHASHIEYGVRGENVKVGTRMIGALAEWALRKGFARDTDEAMRVAWKIARTMASSVRFGGKTHEGSGRGIFARGKGLRIMERANEQLPRYIEEEVAREVERAISGGGT